MARTRTLAELRAEVRQRADCEGDPHITDSELTRYINQSITALHALLVDLDEGEFLSWSDITTTPGSETVKIDTLPSGVYKLAHVHATVQGQVVELERWTFERYTLYQNAAAWGVPGQPISYRLFRDKQGVPGLIFAPVPPSAYTIRVFYVTPFLDLSLDLDTFDGRDGWEEWVVIDSAIKCRVKSDEGIRDLQTEREKVEARIRDQMRSPDLDRPSSIRDTVTADKLSRYAPWVR